MVDCFQACTAHATCGTDISMQDVVLVVPSPKSLVLSSHHQSLSRTRKVRSLQPIKGLFRINNIINVNGCGPKISLGATFWAPVSNSTGNPECHRRMKQGNERMGEWSASPEMLFHDPSIGKLICPYLTFPSCDQSHC